MQRTPKRGLKIAVVDEDKRIVAPYPPHLMFLAPYMTNADLGSDGSRTGLRRQRGKSSRPHNSSYWGAHRPWPRLARQVLWGLRVASPGICPAPLRF
jgi:hypothetical protein